MFEKINEGVYTIAKILKWGYMTSATPGAFAPVRDIRAKSSPATMPVNYKALERRLAAQAARRQVEIEAYRRFLALKDDKNEPHAKITTPTIPEPEPADTQEITELKV